MEDSSQFYHIGHPLLQSRQCHLAFRPQPEVRAGATARPASSARPGHAEHRCTALTPLSLSARDHKSPVFASASAPDTVLANRTRERPLLEGKQKNQQRKQSDLVKRRYLLSSTLSSHWLGSAPNAKLINCVCSVCILKRNFLSRTSTERHKSGNTMSPPALGLNS